MKILLIFIMICITGSQAKSQCDKKVIWHASKAEMVDATGTLLNSKGGNIIVETDPQKITLTFKESTEDGLEGTVKGKTCDWKEAFKNGKTVYQTNVSVDGKTSNAIFTVEAKDDKITISLEITMMGGKKFVIHIDKYEEIK